MVQHHEHPGSLVPQEISFDNADQPGIAQPYSQTEIEDLVYGNDRPVAERLARLEEIRAEMYARESGDFGGDDPAALLGEIERAIAELRTDRDAAETAGNFQGTVAADPADHLDALAPDDVDPRRALEEGEEAFYDDDEEGPADDDHWDGSEEFHPDLR